MIFLFGMIAEALIVLIPMPAGLPSLPPLLGKLGKFAQAFGIDSLRSIGSQNPEQNIIYDE